MDKQEIKELVERVRKAKNREVFSEFIRIAQSDLYDWEPVRRSLLLQIAFLQVNDAKTKVPQHSPFKGDYVGWCYASQKYLACRVGTSEGYVKQCIRAFKRDGVIETREWTDHLGYSHTEYHVIEEVVTEHQRPEDYLELDRKQPRRGGNKAANKGSFKEGNQARAMVAGSRNQGSLQPNPVAVSSREPRKLAADGQGSSQALANGCKLPQVRDIQPETNSGGCSLASSTGRAIASAAAGQRDEQSGSGASARSKTSKPIGTIVHAPKKPLPNRLCYPELFKNRIGPNGEWLGGRVPRCNRCHGNLQPEENHVCPGYVPELPYEDMADHMEFMEAQRESAHEELMARRQVEREERLEELKEELGDETHEFEFGAEAAE